MVRVYKRWRDPGDLAELSFGHIGEKLRWVLNDIIIPVLSIVDVLVGLISIPAAAVSRANGCRIGRPGDAGVIRLLAERDIGKAHFLPLPGWHTVLAENGYAVAGRPCATPLFGARPVKRLPGLCGENVLMGDEAALVNVRCIHLICQCVLLGQIPIRLDLASLDVGIWRGLYLTKVVGAPRRDFVEAVHPAVRPLDAACAVALLEEVSQSVSWYKVCL